MRKTRSLTTFDLEMCADRLAQNPTRQEIEDARKALLWCAKVCVAADEIVRKESVILASARRQVAPKDRP